MMVRDKTYKWKMDTSSAGMIFEKLKENRKTE